MVPLRRRVAASVAVWFRRAARRRESGSAGQGGCGVVREPGACVVQVRHRFAPRIPELRRVLADLADSLPTAHGVD